ncbi:hypothetical protein GCM10027191_14800 [Novilysobacter erysipheiresistens]
MIERKRLTGLWCVAIVAGLTGCQASMPPSIKPAPPLVTDCLAAPSSDIAPVPVPPEVLTDAWALAMWRWASGALAAITADRTQWQGERDCVRGKASTGAIR